MNQKLIQLSEKRERLVNRAAQQRVALRQEIEPWRVPLALADRSIVALHYVRRHPHWMVAIVILLTVARPSRAWKWLERVLITWQVVKTVSGSSQRSAATPQQISSDRRSY